jgi:DNA invertase Pin-like site-specific DNA recombinase
MGPGRGDGSSHTGTSAHAATGQGLTRANRARPGLRKALAACRAGDTLVVTKLDRLARSLRDAKDIVDELTRCEVKLSIGGSVHDPTDPVDRLLFIVLAMVAEFEADLIRARTREGMAVAKAKGRLRGKQPKLSKNQKRYRLFGCVAETDVSAGQAWFFPLFRFLENSVQLVLCRCCHGPGLFRIG